MKFSDLGLKSEILEAVKKQGYEKPSPIQEKAIPAVLSGKDVLAAAQTGTGKTAGFTLPLLDILSRGSQVRNNQCRALILTPTRELTMQVSESVQKYGSRLPLRYTQVFGGVKINPQMMRLRKGTDILVATPGRLLDLYQQNAVKFDDLEVVILDEADRMLDMGFIHDIRKIVRALPKERQNLMFSATFSNEIRRLAKEFVNSPVEISVTPQNTTAKTVTQLMHPVDKRRKAELLVDLIEQHRWHQVLVFARTKRGSDRLAKYLSNSDINAMAIHGDKTQNARTRALHLFKSSKLQVLVATDIAARGLDIEQLPQVVNYDLPDVAEDYVHRIGRTGRAGARGRAISLVSADEVEKLSDIEHLIKSVIKREYVGGFEPDHEVPKTDLKRRTKLGKDAKKGRGFHNYNKKNKAEKNRGGNNSGNSRNANKGSNKSGYGKSASRNQRNEKHDDSRKGANKKSKQAQGKAKSAQDVWGKASSSKKTEKRPSDASKKSFSKKNFSDITPKSKSAAKRSTQTTSMKRTFEDEDGVVIRRKKASTKKVKGKPTAEDIANRDPNKTSRKGKGAAARRKAKRAKAGVSKGK